MASATSSDIAADTAPADVTPRGENRDLGERDPGQLDPGQLDPGQLDPGQLDPGQHDPGQHDPGQLGMREFEHSLPMALMRAREVVMRGFRPILTQNGLTEQQWRVLRALAEANAPRSVGELADATFLLGPSLSRMLASLDDRDLVTRSTGDADARRADIEITRRGRDLVASIAPQSERHYDRIEHHLGADDLAELYTLLHRVAELD